MGSALGNAPIMENHSFLARLSFLHRLWAVAVPAFDQVREQQIAHPAPRFPF